MLRRNITGKSSSQASLEEPLLNSRNFSELNINMVNVSSRDRTTEFQSTIRAFQTRVATKPQFQNKDSRHMQQRNQFMIAAKSIGKDLSSTCVKLEKLTTLAKKRSLFDDKPAEIQELTYIIKQDINNLNKQISVLQQLVKSNENNDTKNRLKHSSNVVISLQSKLANMSKEFQNVLEVRNENLKQQTARKEQFVKSGNGSAMSFIAPKLPDKMGKSVLIEDLQSNGETVINMDTPDKQQYQQRLMLMDEQDNYVRERANAMESIEQTIVDLGTIFQQLATMIKEQDELVQRIDHNVEEAEHNVSAAHTELLKYFQSITSNRWLVVKIFLVLIVFFVIFILFAA